jgi:DNA-binding Lrp family transcriptional regulator
MDELDSKILDLLENDFPLQERPYDLLSERLQVSPELFLARLERMMTGGVVRRIGASLDSRRLGLKGTLAAACIEPEAVDKAVEVICRHDEVTHCYLRSDRFNIWFTVIAPDEAGISGILDRIGDELGLGEDRLLNLPARRLFKLDARFSRMPGDREK